MVRQEDIKERKRRFVAEYLVDLNATRAAIAVGISESQARYQASRWLADPDVQAALVIGRKRLVQKTSISTDRVLRELAAIAFSKITDVMTWNAKGEITLRCAADDLPDDVARAIESIRIEDTANGRKIVVKLYDKLRALDRLAAHLGLDARSQINLALLEEMAVAHGLTLDEVLQDLGTLTGWSVAELKERATAAV